MAKPRNIDELIHDWAHQRQDSASSGNVRYEGPRLYSYAECIAKILPSGSVVFTTRHWSPTTASHLSAARRATNDKPAVWAYGPHWSAKENRDLVERNIAMMAGRMPDPVMKKDGKTETMLSKKRRVEATSEILRTVQKFNEYLAATGDTNVKPIPEPNIEDMKQAMQELARLEEQRRQAEEKKRDEDAKGMLQKWRKHETHVTSVRTSAPALRMSQDGNWVETSWGARIPEADAAKLWPLILRTREQKQDYVVPGRVLTRMAEGEPGTRLGNFNLNKINADGSIVVGCHQIAWDEIEYIAILMGFITLKEQSNG